MTFEIDSHSDALENQEVNFRRGYVEGYEAALDDLLRMIDSGTEPKLMYRVMNTHFENDIAAWRRRARADAAPPPRLAAD